MMGIKSGWGIKKSDSSDTAFNINTGAKMIQKYLVDYDYDIALALSAYFLSAEEAEKELQENGDLPRDEKCRKFIRDVLFNMNGYVETEGQPVIKKEVLKSGKVLFYNVAPAASGK